MVDVRQTRSTVWNRLWTFVESTLGSTRLFENSNNGIKAAH